MRGKQALPVAATLVAGVLPMLLFIPLQSPGIYDILIAFTVIGFFLAFTFPVLGIAIAKFTGKWEPLSDGPLFLGKWAPPVSWIALAWLVFETVNVLWPRPSGSGWLVDWSSMLATLVIFAIGSAIYAVMRGRRRNFDQRAMTRPGQVVVEGPGPRR
ncbi:hypothetical protein GCM10009786_11710 [Leucobacter alluvii]|uniref:Amino acid permease n=1 Tax=Leucobacter alluvii TaxID=340321 RepID=A0ABN3B4S3_9MICO